MIKIERENDLTRLSAAVTDFSESLGYCQYKIPLSMRGAKSETSVALVKGAIAHRDEEMFEQEHVQLEPVTTEQVQDSSLDIEFAREDVFSALHIPFEFPSQNVLVSLYGRIDKMMRVGSTLIIQDDKFTTKPKSYDLLNNPYPGQLLQVLTYLNSSFSMKKFANPLEYFQVAHEQKKWQIRICDSRTKKPYKIYSDYQNSDSQKYLHGSLRLFASIALGQTEPSHHNSKAKCNACSYKKSCEYRIQ